MSNAFGCGIVNYFLHAHSINHARSTHAILAHHVGISNVLDQKELGRCPIYIRVDALPRYDSIIIWEFHYFVMIMYPSCIEKNLPSA